MTHSSVAILKICGLKNPCFCVLLFRVSAVERPPFFRNDGGGVRGDSDVRDPNFPKFGYNGGEFGYNEW